MAPSQRHRPIIAVIGLLVLILLLQPRDRARPVTSAQATVPTIPYSVVQTWDIPCSGHGGAGRVIVVDSQFRSDSGLRRLGTQLHGERPDEWCSVVEVFDDSLLATVRQTGIVQKLPKAKQKRFDAHYIATYIRMRRTGHNALTYGLGGLTKYPLEQVTY